MVRLHSLLSPTRSFNGYGLFAMMTTARPEIIIEGSNDNQTWLPYEFKYKPGDPTRRPAFVAPHQPRLDWQMWFEALNVMTPHYEPSSWFMNFCVRILQGQPEVLALLKTNPFPNSPPRYLRATVYRLSLHRPGHPPRNRCLVATRIDRSRIALCCRYPNHPLNAHTAALPSRNGPN